MPEKQTLLVLTQRKIARTDGVYCGRQCIHLYDRDAARPFPVCAIFGADIRTDERGILRAPGCIEGEVPTDGS